MAHTPPRRSEQIITYKDASGQISDWRIEGISTACDLTNVIDPLTEQGNTDKGLLYVTLAKSGTTVTISVYKDGDKVSGDLVLQGTYTDDEAENTVTLAEQNNSAMSGTVKCLYSTDDSDIFLLVSFCVDSDLYLLTDNLRALIPEGFDSAAFWCIESSRQVYEWLTHRFRDELAKSSRPVPTSSYQVTALLDESLLPEPDRIQNPHQLTLASAHLALHGLLSRRVKEAEDTFAKRAAYHMEQYQQALESIGIDLDLDGDEDVDSWVSAGSVRVLRA